MTEGWSGDDYLILFAESERAAAEGRYEFSTQLPGFRLVGLRGWDEFIVQDTSGRTFRIPTVPLDLQYLAPYGEAGLKATLTPDSRFSGKVKWYVKPVVFGGDPNLGPNVTWVDHEQHGQFVKWWNDFYHSVKTKP